MHPIAAPVTPNDIILLDSHIENVFSQLENTAKIKALFQSVVTGLLCRNAASRDFVPTKSDYRVGT